MRPFAVCLSACPGGGGRRSRPISRRGKPGAVLGQIAEELIPVGLRGPFRVVAMAMTPASRGRTCRGDANEFARSPMTSSPRLSRACDSLAAQLGAVGSGGAVLQIAGRHFVYGYPPACVEIDVTETAVCGCSRVCAAFLRAKPILRGPLWQVVLGSGVQCEGFL